MRVRRPRSLFIFAVPRCMFYFKINKLNIKNRYIKMHFIQFNNLKHFNPLTQCALKCKFLPMMGFSHLQQKATAKVVFCLLPT